MRLPLPKTVVGQQRWFGISSLLLVTLTATAIAGPLGLIVGAILAVSRARLPPEFTFTLGQFALLAVIGDPTMLTRSSTFTLSLIVLAEAGLLLMLLLPPADSAQPAPQSETIILASGITVTAVVGWLLTQWVSPLWIAVTVLAGGGGFIVYAIRQYEHHHLNQPQQELSQ